MKLTSLFIFLLTYLVGNSQPTHHFIIEDGSLVWQKVFETDLNYIELCQAFKENGVLVSIDTTNNKIKGQTAKFPIDYKSAGYGRLSTPFYLLDSQVDGFALIEFKDKQYRVTFKNIKSKYLTVTMAMTTNVVEDNIDSYAIKKGKFKYNFELTDSKILEYSINKFFTIKKAASW